MLAQESAGNKGGNNNPEGSNQYGHRVVNLDNIQVDHTKKYPDGTSTAATMRRLAKDFPNVHAEVLQRPAIEVDSEANQRVATMAENAKPLAEHAGEYTKTGGRGNKLHDNHQVVSADGTSAEYLTARIARDRPDILET